MTQLISNAMFYNSDTPEDTMQRIRKYYAGHGPLLEMGLPSWSEPIREFFCAYDAFVEAKKAIEYKDSPDGIPVGVIKHFW